MLHVIFQSQGSVSPSEEMSLVNNPPAHTRNMISQLMAAHRYLLDTSMHWRIRIRYYQQHLDPKRVCRLDIL